MNVAEIKSVIADQKEEIERVFRKERIIEREFLDMCRPLMESDLIKVITGVRRSGKSVFSLELLGGRDYGYINFDDERLIGIKTSDLNLVLQAFYELFGELKFVFLDEIQNIEGWELFVNRLKRAGLNVLVTGSNAKLLSRELATHLTGRHAPIEMFPFSFREFLLFAEFKAARKAFYSTKQKAFLIRKLQEYLELGGFPEVLKERENAKIYLATLYSTILTRDVVSRQRIKFIRTIREISNYLVSNFSKPITFNKIKNIFDLKSAHTSKNYISYLEESYLIFLLGKFSFKHKEVLASPKKVYAIDTGMVGALGFKSNENFGRLIENMVFIELARKRVLGRFQEFFYWKDYTGKEVDFVIKEGLKVKQLIQVTYASGRSEIEKRETVSLIKASEELRCNNLLILTWDFEGEEKIKGKKIIYTPLWKWLLNA